MLVRIKAPIETAAKVKYLAGRLDERQALVWTALTNLALRSADLEDLTTLLRTELAQLQHLKRPVKRGQPVRWR